MAPSSPHLDTWVVTASEILLTAPSLPVPAPLTTLCPGLMPLPLRTFSTKLASGRPPGQAAADRASLQVSLRDYRTGRHVPHSGFLVTAGKAQGQRIMLSLKQPLLEDQILGLFGMFLTRRKPLLLPLPLCSVMALLWQLGAVKRHGIPHFQTLPPNPEGATDWKQLMDSVGWHTQAVAKKQEAWVTSKATWIAVGYPRMIEQVDPRGSRAGTTCPYPAQMSNS